MTLRAETNPRYYIRFGLITLMCFGFSLWSLFDGYVTYPNQRVRGLEYEKLKEEGRENEWAAIAKEKDWPTEYPGEPKTENVIKGQYIMAVVTGILGLGFLIFVFRSRGRWIEATETGLVTSWGKQLDYDQIVKLNKKSWKSKGIARVRGRKARIVLDDCKYDRPATEEILRLVESKIDIDLIVGGAPEPPVEYVEDEEA